MRSTIHEMRNQLAVAFANVEAFVDGKLEPTPQRLDAVLQALGKLDALMSLLPVAGRSEPAQARLRSVDVCALIAGEKIGMEASAAAAGIALDADACTVKHSECSHFMCDPVQVSQVVKNVLLNAIKYTPAGGRVKITCHRERGTLALEIDDNGPGVPRDERQAIFERGVRGSAAAAACGSGVGLAVVRDILDAHGGTVSVDDSPLGGARFVIRLPGDASAPVPVRGACSACAAQPGVDAS